MKRRGKKPWGVNVVAGKAGEPLVANVDMPIVSVSQIGLRGMGLANDNYSEDG